MAIIKSELRPKKEDGTYGDVVYLKTSYDLIEGAPKVRNSLEEIATGNALDATQGKVLKTAIESKANVIHTHTSSEITGIPISLPANGGNSDTVDGKHATDFVSRVGGSLGFSDGRALATSVLIPSYYTWGDRSGITLQILNATQVGLTGDFFVHARTEIPWNDTSGVVTQYISGNGKEYVRYSASDSTWTVPKILGEGCNASTLNGLNSSQLGTTDANGGSHGSGYLARIRHNVHGDNRFKLELAGGGYETRVDYASNTGALDGKGSGSFAQVGGTVNNGQTKFDGLFVGSTGRGYIYPEASDTILSMRAGDGATYSYFSIGTFGARINGVPVYTSHNANGLGNACVQISDWNNATTNGYYMGSGAANAPDAGWWIGTTLVHNVNWIVQRVCAFSSNQQWITRYKIDGTWRAWGIENDRKTYTSTATPSGGNNGDIWIRYS